MYFTGNPFTKTNSGKYLVFCQVLLKLLFYFDFHMTPPAYYET